MQTKVLSVVANASERAEGPSFGLVRAIENTIAKFLEENGGTEAEYSLAGTAIDAGQGSAQDTQAVFGRTLIVLKYKPGEKPEHKPEHKKKK